MVTVGKKTRNENELNSITNKVLFFECHPSKPVLGTVLQSYLPVAEKTFKKTVGCAEAAKKQ